MLWVALHGTVMLWTASGQHIPTHPKFTGDQQELLEIRSLQFTPCTDKHTCCQVVDCTRYMYIYSVLSSTSHHMIIRDCVWPHADTAHLCLAQAHPPNVSRVLYQVMCVHGTLQKGCLVHIVGKTTTPFQCTSIMGTCHCHKNIIHNGHTHLRLLYQPLQ